MLISSFFNFSPYSLILHYIYIYIYIVMRKNKFEMIKKTGTFLIERYFVIIKIFILLMFTKLFFFFFCAIVNVFPFIADILLCVWYASQNLILLPFQLLIHDNIASIIFYSSFTNIIRNILQLFVYRTLYFLDYSALKWGLRIWTPGQKI